MFENQSRDDVEALLKSNKEFRALYQRHRELDSKVHDADIGVLPIPETKLAVMKREKLYAKDRLQRIWDAQLQRKH